VGAGSWLLGALADMPGTNVQKINTSAVSLDG
jgi:hypothetical protein